MRLASLLERSNIAVSLMLLPAGLIVKTQPAPPLRDGVLMEGVDRPPTLEDVAREAGVSRALVSLALRGSTRVSARSRDRIRDAASRLGYRPNLNARNLAARLSGILGVLVSDLHNPFFAEVVDGLSAEAAEHGWQVILATGQAHRAGEQAALETLLSLRPAGIALTGPVLDRATIERAAAAVPLVVVNRLLRSDRLDSVTIDEYAGSALAVRHLVDLGHRRITHIDGGTGAGATSRRTGYLRAMRRYAPGERADVLRGGFTESAGWRATDKLLRSARHADLHGRQEPVRVADQPGQPLPAPAAFPQRLDLPLAQRDQRDLGRGEGAAEQHEGEHEQGVDQRAAHPGQCTVASPGQPGQ